MSIDTHRVVWGAVNPETAIDIKATELAAKHADEQRALGREILHIDHSATRLSTVVVQEVHETRESAEALANAAEGWEALNKHTGAPVRGIQYFAPSVAVDLALLFRDETETEIDARAELRGIDLALGAAQQAADRDFGPSHILCVCTGDDEVDSNCPVHGSVRAIEALRGPKAERIRKKYADASKSMAGEAADG